MAKSFKGGMDSLLGGNSSSPRNNGAAAVAAEPAVQRGRKKTNFKVITKQSQVGTKENETRATFIVNEDQLETVKALAYWERRSIKEVLASALDAYISGKGAADVKKAKELYKAKGSPSA